MDHLRRIAWLLLRREPNRGSTLRWIVLVVAGIAGVTLAISLLTLASSDTRLNDASERTTEVTP